jgi:transmembrane sensor
MTGATGPEELDGLHDEAAVWLVRVQSDAATGEDWLALERWLAGAPERLAAFEAVERLSAELDEHAPELLARLDRPASVHALRPRRPAARRARWRPAWAVAASLVIAAVAFWRLYPPPPSAQVFSTALGERRTVILADGSRIDLNSASRLVARVGARSRRVTLVGGEAVFDVAKDPDHPFVISVGDERVRVVGTEFDILRHQGRITVTVSRGVVEVKPARPGGAATRLVAGQQLSHREGEPGAVVAPAAVQDVFAWRKGYLVYRDRRLGEIAADLGRYYATPVRVEGPAAGLTFTGVLKLGRQDEVLAQLQSFLPIEVVRRQDRIILRSR